MKDPLVSICCITYNHASFIEEAIESFLMQKTTFSIEILINDDASTDGTTEILKQYEKKYPDVIFPIYHKENEYSRGIKGIMARNVFPKAHGKYIALCEGDDYWTDEYKLQKQVDFLEAHEEYVICFHKILIHKNGTLVEDYITKVPADTTDQSHLITTNYIHTLSVVFRNTLKQYPRWFSKAFPGDYALWFILTKSGGKIKNLQDCMGVYRVHANGLWSGGGNTKRQVISSTLLNCARYINTRQRNFINHNINELSQTVYDRGYNEISRSRYLILSLWSFGRIYLTTSEKLKILFPVLFRFYRRLLKR